jgi:hypothetical protein
MSRHPIFGGDYRATTDGQWVNAMHQRVATMVTEYDPEIFLAWIPPADRQPGDEVFAYMLVHEHPDGSQYVMSYWSEDELNPDAVMSWVWENDFRKHHPNDIFNKVQASALAQQLYDAKVTEEEAAEKWEFAQSVLKSRLHTYKHKGKKYR